MKKFTAIMLGLLMIIGLAACTQKQPEPESQDESGIMSEQVVRAFLEALPDDPMEDGGIGFVVNTADGVVHEDLWDAFKAEAAAGTPSQVMLGGYNMQGEGIYYCLTFDGDKYILYIDNSRDSGFGGEDTWRVYTAKNLFDIEWDLEEEDGMFHYRSAFISDIEGDRNDPEVRFNFDHDQFAVWGRRDPVAQ